MNKPRIFPKGSNFKTCKIKQICISVIGYIHVCKAFEIQYFTVNRCKQAEITLVLVRTSIFAFSYATYIQ